MGGDHPGKNAKLVHDAAAPSEDDRAAVRSCVLSALRRFASDESEDEHYAWAGHTLIIPRWEIYPADIVILTLPDAGKTKIGVDRTVLTQKLKANRWTKIENGSKRRLALVEPADGGLLTADDSPYHQIVAGLTPLPGHEPGAGFDPTGCSTFTPYVDGGPRAWQLA